MSAGPPSAMTLPWWRTVIRSERASTWSMSCSMSTIVTDPRSSRIRLATRGGSGAANPASGSSRRRRWGRVARAIPISRSRWSPWERLLAAVNSRPASPTRCTSRNASSLRSRRRSVFPSREKRRGCLACTAMRTFSNTVRAWKTLMIWNEREMPAATIRGGGGRDGEGAPAGPPAHALEDADDAVRGEEDEDDEDHAEVDQPVLGPGGQGVAHEHEHGGSHGRPHEGLHPAHERHRRDLARHRHMERLRVGEVQEERVERAGEAAERAGQDEGGQLVALDVVADAARPLPVLADGFENPPER